MPSIWYENCPYSILETLVVGKPVIGSKIAGIPELVKDNKTGLLNDLGNIEQLTEKMKILYKDADIARKMGEQARKDAIIEFDKKQYYNKIIKVYKDLIEEKKK